MVACGIELGSLNDEELEQLYADFGASERLWRERKEYGLSRWYRNGRTCITIECSARFLFTRQLDGQLSLADLEASS